MCAVVLTSPLACRGKGTAVGSPWLEVPDAVELRAVYGVSNEAVLAVDNVGLADVRVSVTVNDPFQTATDSYLMEAGSTTSVVLLVTPAVP